MVDESMRSQSEFDIQLEYSDLVFAVNHCVIKLFVIAISQLRLLLRLLFVLRRTIMRVVRDIDFVSTW